MKLGYNKGVFCEPHQVVTPVDSVGFNRGYAAFDFLKVVGGRPFVAKRHVERFFKTMAQLRIVIPYDAEGVLGIIEQLASGSDVADFGIKLFAIPMELTDGVSFAAEFAAVPVCLPQYDPALFTDGAALASFEYQRFLPEAKSTHYLPSVFWEAQVQAKGALEALFVANGKVLETSRSNLFICKNGRVCTPECGVLQGVTRSLVLEMLREAGVPEGLEDISWQSLLGADEVWITSTTKGVLPIVRVDDHVIANGHVGPLSRSLQEHYLRLLSACH